MRAATLFAIFSAFGVHNDISPDGGADFQICIDGGASALTARTFRLST
jgi:hypothetical protein